MSKHPDPDHVCKCTAMEKAKAWSVVIGSVFVGLTSLAGAVVTGLNRWGPSGQIEHSEKVDKQAKESNVARETIEKKIDKVEATLFIPPDKRGSAPKSEPEKNP